MDCYAVQRKNYGINRCITVFFLLCSKTPPLLSKLKILILLRCCHIKKYSYVVPRYGEILLSKNPKETAEGGGALDTLLCTDLTPPRKSTSDARRRIHLIIISSTNRFRKNLLNNCIFSRYLHNRNTSKRQKS